MLAVDTGDFVHLLLQKTAKKASEIESESEMRAYAMREGAEILKTSVYAMQQDTSSGLIFLDKLLNEGADVAVAAYRQIKNSTYEVEATEMSVSAADWHGKVDRVDATDKFVRVIDYKTGSIDDKALSYYTGRKLQMQLYPKM